MAGLLCRIKAFLMAGPLPIDYLAWLGNSLLRVFLFQLLMTNARTLAGKKKYKPALRRLRRLLIVQEQKESAHEPQGWFLMEEPIIASCGSSFIVQWSPHSVARKVIVLVSLAVMSKMPLLRILSTVPVIVQR